MNELFEGRPETKTGPSKRAFNVLQLIEPFPFNYTAYPPISTLTR
jgi:hypothetical protein